MHICCKSRDCSPNHYKLLRGQDLFLSQNGRAKMTLKVTVNDLHFQYQPKASQYACLVQIWWFYLKSATNYHADNANFTDGRTQATTIPFWPERPKGKMHRVYREVQIHAEQNEVMQNRKFTRCSVHGINSKWQSCYSITVTPTIITHIRFSNDTYIRHVCIGEC